MGDSSSMPGDGRGHGRAPVRTVSRRTVARGAAWTAPVAVVSVAAPAFATSKPPCQVQTNFDGLQVGTKPSVLTFLPSTITATVSWSASYGSDNTPGGTGTVARTSTSPAWNYLECEMLSPITAGRTVTLTIHLSAPVTNLGFRVHDIDKTADGWDDLVVVSTPGKAYTSARGANVVGDGSSGAPFRNNVTGDQAIDSGLNHVDLSWAGPIQDVQLVYKAGKNGNSGNQHIGIGNISFTDCVANPHGYAAVPADRLAVARGSFVTGASTVLVAGRDN